MLGKKQWRANESTASLSNEHCAMGCFSNSCLLLESMQRRSIERLDAEIATENVKNAVSEDVPAFVAFLKQ